MGLGRPDSRAIRPCSRGSYLIERQNGDGTWKELKFTGTGFPQVFYLRYHYYRIYFPLMAMSRWHALVVLGARLSS